MTALDRYIRLEATGLWRENPDTPPREVLLSFGNATLCLSDFSDAPLTHWSLAAVRRQGDQTPALYALDDDSDEQLEVSDPDMIEAIAEVTRLARASADPPRPARRGLRRWGVLAVFLLLFSLLAARGPDLLRDSAYALMPQSQKDLLTEDIRANLAVKACAGPEGHAVLQSLAAPARVDIMPWDTPLILKLPDHTLLLSHRLIGPAATPDSLTGWITAAKSQPQSASPLRLWIDSRPLKDLVTFISTGNISSADKFAMARAATLSQGLPSDDAIATALDALASQNRPDASFLTDLKTHMPGKVLPAPQGSGMGSVPLMPDQNWVALTQICEN